MTEERVASTIVTSENLAEFQAHRMGLTEEPVETEKPAEEIKEEEVKAEEVIEEEPKKKKTPKGNVPVSERIATYAQQRRDAEARAVAAEAELAELKKPKEEVKEEVPVGKPDPSAYTDAFKYAEDLSAWTVKNTLEARDKIEREAKVAQAREVTMKNWQTRQNEVKAEYEDYEEKVGESQVKVSAEVREAIFESELGPRILYHLAENPDIAEKLATLTIGGALKELGRIEAKLEKPLAKQEKAVETKERAEISKAPSPITPLNGGKGATEDHINRAGEFTGDYQTWKALRLAGKIH